MFKVGDKVKCLKHGSYYGSICIIRYINNNFAELICANKIFYCNIKDIINA